jgi:hypothetical protein
MPQEKMPPEAGHGLLHRSETPRLLIYRAGAATPMNMTPRSTDMDGLSAFRDVPSTPDCRYQVIDTAKLHNLRAFCDDESIGHFCIVPRELSRMQEWIATRGKATHSFTEELLNAIISERRT